jgi:hypothetical protein
MMRKRFTLLAAVALAAAPSVLAQPQPAAPPPIDETLAPYAGTADSKPQAVLDAVAEVVNKARAAKRS